MCALVVGGCGGTAGQGADMAGPNFGGGWTGSLTHPAATCSDGSVKAAFTTTTSWQINQSQAGLFLIWTDRCPAAGNIAFSVDASGVARQQGDPALCLDTAAAQATFGSGVMMLAGDSLTLTINEKEHDLAAPVRDCEYPVSAMMTRQ
jgi:hypothetical protein